MPPLLVLRPGDRQLRWLAPALQTGFVRLGGRISVHDRDVPADLDPPSLSASVAKRRGERESRHEVIRVAVRMLAKPRSETPREAVAGLDRAVCRTRYVTAAGPVHVDVEDGVLVGLRD